MEIRGRGRRTWRDRLVGRRRTLAVAVTGLVGLMALGAILVVLPGAVVDHDLAGASVDARQEQARRPHPSCLS